MNTSIAPRLGIHFSTKQGLAHVAREALAYNITYVQFFLPTTEHGKYIKNLDDQQQFLLLKKKYSLTAYIHCSYWINPATGNKISYNVSKSLLKKEITCAKSLEIPYLVLHAGVAKNHQTPIDDPVAKKAGIATVAKCLNSVLKNESDITILLENCAHGNKIIGNDFDDFLQVRKQLEFPDRVKFCLDCAHAYAYGYQLENTENFIKMLDITLGIENIKLIHFNDSAESQASQKDKHALPGQGFIGKKTLQKLILHPTLNDIPLIIEPPRTSSFLLQKCLFELRDW